MIDSAVPVTMEPEADIKQNQSQLMIGFVTIL